MSKVGSHISDAGIAVRFEDCDDPFPVTPGGGPHHRGHLTWEMGIIVHKGDATQFPAVLESPTYTGEPAQRFADEVTVVTQRMEHGEHGRCVAGVVITRYSHRHVSHHHTVDTDRKGRAHTSRVKVHQLVVGTSAGAVGTHEI